MITCIKPKICCKGACHTFCVDKRAVFWDFETCALLDPKFPCMFNMFGITCFYKWKFLPLFCLNWKEINVAFEEAVKLEAAQAAEAAKAAATAGTTPLNPPTEDKKASSEVVKASEPEIAVAVPVPAPVVTPSATEEVQPTPLTKE